MKILNDQDFIISRHALDDVPFIMPLAFGYSLYAGATLKVTAIDSPARRLIVLGDFWHPLHPELNEHQLLHALYSPSASSSCMRPFTGRFVTISIADTITLSLDPCGLFEVFFTDKPVGDIRCGNRPSLVAPLDTTYTPILTSSLAPDTWFPGALTHDTSIRQLVPHHQLDLCTGSITRIWPDSPRVPANYDSALAAVSQSLRGSARAISLRKERFAVALSAGVDSRVAWCAFRSILSNICSFTLQYAFLNDEHPDIVIPQRLVEQFGGSHTLIPATTIAEGTARFLDHFGSNACLINSNLLEIGRCYYFFPKTLFCSDLLLAYETIPNTHRVKAELQCVLDDLSAIERKYGWDRRDVFYWEQRMGHWAASGWRSNTGVTFNIFNNQQLLETLLSVAPRYRQGHCGRFYADLMELFCPGASTIPINPPACTLKSRIKAKTKHLFGVALLRSVALFIRSIFLRIERMRHSR